MRDEPGPGFRPVAATEVVRLAQTARAAYLPYYDDLWSDGGGAYVERAFAPQVLAAELAAPGSACWWIESGGDLAGYLKCLAPAPPASSGEPAGVLPVGSAAPRGLLYLERLYLLPGHAGQGLGAAALRFAASHAAGLGLPGVWLRAMSYQPRVVGFYERHGYVRCGTDRLTAPGVIPGREGMLRLVQRPGRTDAT